MEHSYKRSVMASLIIGVRPDANYDADAIPFLMWSGILVIILFKKQTNKKASETREQLKVVKQGRLPIPADILVDM